MLLPSVLELAGYALIYENQMPKFCLNNTVFVLATALEYTGSMNLKFDTVTAQEQTGENGKLDRFSILLSAICLVHCVSVPVLFLIGGYVTSVAILTEHFVHQILLLIALPLSLFSLGKGYRIHKNRKVGILGLCGLIFLVLGVFSHESLSREISMTILGSCLLAIAHLFNLRLRTKYFPLES